MKASFANDDRSLWPGEFVAVRLLLGTQSKAIVVPARAVLTGSGRTYVYLQKPDSTAEPRLVRVGSTVDGFIALISGVTPDDTVVLDGQARLFPGAKVQASRAPGEATAGRAAP